MDAWLREIRHQMEFWLWRLTSLLFITASFGALAGTEVVKPVEPREVYWSTPESIFPNAEEACRAAASGNVVKFTFNSAICIQWNLPHTLCAANCAWTYKNFQGEIVWWGEGHIAQTRLCPKPKTHLDTPYYFWPETEECMRPSFNDYSITLTSRAEVEPSNGSTIKTLPFIATVKDQNDQPVTDPVKVYVSVKVDPTSGGHGHGDSTRPRGGIANVGKCASDDECWSNETDGNGQVVFNFNAPEASGTHAITATCDGCGNTETKSVDVKVDGLVPIPPSGLYALYETDGSVIGAVTNRHESNHYLIPPAANKLLVVAINYHHLYPKDPVLHINDASLLWGGKFDIYGTWKGKHVEHQRGTVVDIRANTRAGAIPPTNFVNFEKFARFTGADPYLENQGTDLQHYHLRLLNRRE